MQKIKKIGVDARLRDGEPGGVQQILIGLAQGFSEIKLVDIEITFILLEGHEKWLLPFLSGNLKHITVPDRVRSIPRSRALLILRKIARSLVAHTFGAVFTRIQSMPLAVGKANFDLIHFVHQHVFETNLPFIFMPQDFQHEYFPDNFTKREVAVRKWRFKKHCIESSLIACISEATRQDVIKYIGVPKEKTSVFYCAPPTRGYIKSTFDRWKILQDNLVLPKPYLLYPAKTFAHKNHTRLLHAIKRVNEEMDMRINLVCTGGFTDHYEKVIRPLIERLTLTNFVRFTGFLPPEDLTTLYENCDAVIFPSEFEGFGMPVVEAFHAGKCVLCSDITCMREVSGNAALYFNPTEISEIAKAIEIFYSSDQIRKNLAKLGRARVEQFSWRKTAEDYVKCYKSLV